MPSCRVIGVLASLAATGCIVADPPESEEPERTPPILNLLAAKPFPGAVITIDRTDSATAGDKVEFKIPVRSDDQGESLLAFLFVDRTFTDERVAGIVQVPASTIDDMARSVSILWSADERFSKGCHTISIVVAHFSSWTIAEPPVLLDANDAAVGTWWVNLDPEPGVNPTTLPRCPSPAEVEE